MCLSRGAAEPPGSGAAEEMRSRPAGRRGTEQRPFQLSGAGGPAGRGLRPAGRRAPSSAPFLPGSLPTLTRAVPGPPGFALLINTLLGRVNSMKKGPLFCSSPARNAPSLAHSRRSAGQSHGTVDIRCPFGSCHTPSALRRMSGPDLTYLRTCTLCPGEQMGTISETGPQ